MNNNIAEQTITIGINVKNPEEFHLSAINDFVHALNSGDVKRYDSAPTSQPLGDSDEFISDEYQYQRKILSLLKEFEKRNWEIPKQEIAVINGRIFKNRRQAAALYAKRSGFFAFDARSKKYVGTKKAKEELRRLKELTVRETSNLLPPPNSESDLDFYDPRLVANRMVQAAVTSDSFFSDITAEGLGKLEDSLSLEERGKASEWLQTVTKWFIDNLTQKNPITDFFEFADNVRGHLDSAAFSIKETERMRKEADIRD